MEVPIVVINSAAHKARTLVAPLILLSASFCRLVRVAARHRSSENFLCGGHCIWQPGHNLCPESAPPDVGTPSNDVVCVLFLSGRSHYYCAGQPWNRDGAFGPIDTGM